MLLLKLKLIQQKTNLYSLLPSSKFSTLERTPCSNDTRCAPAQAQATSKASQAKPKCHKGRRFNEPGSTRTTSAGLSGASHGSAVMRYMPAGGAVAGSSSTPAVQHSIGSPGVAVRENTALASSHLLRKKCAACSHPCCKAWLPSEPQARQWPSRRQ